jgi:hypothetical protein
MLEGIPIPRKGQEATLRGIFVQPADGGRELVFNDN